MSGPPGATGFLEIKKQKQRKKVSKLVPLLDSRGQQTAMSTLLPLEDGGFAGLRQETTGNRDDYWSWLASCF